MFDVQEQLTGLQALEKVVLLCLLNGGSGSQVMDFYGNSARVTDEQNALTALQNDDSLDVFGKVFANGLLDEDNTRISDEKKKCIQVSHFMTCHIFIWDKNVSFKNQKLCINNVKFTKIK